MVVRTFDVDEIVQLPRMGAADTIALATALVTRAQAAPALPPIVARQLETMRQDLGVLRGHAETRVQESGQSDSRETVNRTADAAWAALRWWCKGWALLPYPEYASQADGARMLEAQIFPDGLRFTQLAFRNQWVESQARLGLIEREGLAALIATLGGQSILDAVRRAHDDFGRALGITEVPDDPETSAIVRQGMDQLMSSMRRYVLQVTAHAHSGEPGGEALADALLLPIKTWKSRSATPAASDDAPADPPAPTPPAAGLPTPSAG
jgi:hypothetical protein